MGLPVVVLSIISSEAVVAEIRECELFGCDANVTIEDAGALDTLRRSENAAKEYSSLT